MKSIGIVGYGAYIPKYRIRVADIATVWGKNPREIEKSLGITQKSVAAVDEDSVTLALTASQRALASQSMNPTSIGAVFIGSESHPYAVNPSSTITGELLGIGNNYIAADFQFACKAGTAAMIAALGLVESGKIKNGLAIGSDVAQGRPHDVLEYAAAAGSAAFIVGSENVAVELIDYTSFSSDTPDFWRRDGIRYPSHAGRFTGEPAYYAHVFGAIKELFAKTKMTPADIDQCVFHMPNGKFPRDIAKQLGFSTEQLQRSLTVEEIGNPYSASSLLGFARVLDTVAENKVICLVSYGSGAGSDAMMWKTTKKINVLQKNIRAHRSDIDFQCKNTQYLAYTDYLRSTRQL